ncbi:phosphoenolpyruvate carboxykinase [Acrasis kona]|uniref:Phosphoenolpyruvate carboxykinase n=1 Tax=Acrasis kona TaxID=1008807 RepID=A0AAW2YUV0_9EUKA
MKSKPLATLLLCTFFIYSLCDLTNNVRELFADRNIVEGRLVTGGKRAYYVNPTTNLITAFYFNSNYPADTKSIPGYSDTSAFKLQSFFTESENIIRVFATASTGVDMISYDFDKSIIISTKRMNFKRVVCSVRDPSTKLMWVNDGNQLFIIDEAMSYAQKKNPIKLISTFPSSSTLCQLDSTHKRVFFISDSGVNIFDSKKLILIQKIAVLNLSKKIVNILVDSIQNKIYVSSDDGRVIRIGGRTYALSTTKLQIKPTSAFLDPSKGIAYFLSASNIVSSVNYDTSSSLKLLSSDKKILGLGIYDTNTQVAYVLQEGKGVFAMSEHAFSYFYLTTGNVVGIVTLMCLAVISLICVLYIGCCCELQNKQKYSSVPNNEYELAHKSDEDDGY